MTTDANPRTVALVADRLCLNFVNTVDSFDKAQPKEYLRTYGDLLQWSEHVGILSATQVAGLQAEANGRPADASDALERAKELRFALYQLFAAIAEQQPVPIDAFEIVNQAIRSAPRRTRLVATSGGFVWEREVAPRDLDTVLWEVVWSAADLLTSPEVAYVRACSGAGCTWMFLDTSRGRTRRWCAMNWCGNRAKARRHYARQRGDTEDAGAMRMQHASEASRSTAQAEADRARDLWSIPITDHVSRPS